MARNNVPAMTDGSPTGSFLPSIRWHCPVPRCIWNSRASTDWS